MQKHFYSLLMAVFLVIALTLPGKAAKAEASQDDFQYFGEDEAADPNVGGEDFPGPVEEDIPDSSYNNLFGLRADAYNGQIFVRDETADEYGWYYIPVGTTVTFCGNPDNDFYQADSITFFENGEDIVFSNPIITFRDANGDYQYVTPSYEDGWYSFVMPPAETFINISFLPIQDTPVEPGTNSYCLYPDALNGQIVVNNETLGENGYYSIPEWTQVFFYGIPDEGCYQPETCFWNADEGEVEWSNPIIYYYDEDGNCQFFEPLYDNETNCYSFFMQPTDMFISIKYLPVQDTPEDHEALMYGLTAGAYGGNVVVPYETADEYGWYYITEGTEVSFYGIPEENYYQPETSWWLMADDSELELPNPIIYYYDENDNFQYFCPDYDAESGWYTFTMPSAITYINFAFLPIEDIPEDPVEALYPINWYAANGEFRLIELNADEEGYYLAPEGAEVSFSVMPEDGFCYADHINFLVGEEILELPNPLVSYTDDDGVFHYIVPSYDETTGWYTFTMPASFVFINYDFQGIQEPDPAYFIGRVVAEGGSIEFVPENPESSACEGDIVTVEVTADQGYNLDEVVIFNAATLEDGSIEYIEDSYVDFWKNEDGTYSFVMPANPIQIFANFSKPSNPNPGSNGHGNGWGNGFGWGFGHNYGWGYGYGHGIDYGYGHNNYGYGNYDYGYGGYGFGYGYGNSCHSLLGGLVGLLNSWGLFR